MNSLTNEMKNILFYLDDKKYTTAKDLAYKNLCSEKTIRNRIKDIEYFFNKKYRKEVLIESKPRYGYRLIMPHISREQLFKELDLKITFKRSNDILIEDLLLYLVHNSKAYITIDSLEDILYTSNSNIKKILLLLDEILLSYDIKLKRKTKLGIKIEGKERDIRNCISKVISFSSLNKRNVEFANFERFSEKVYSYMLRYNIKISEVYFESFIKLILVSVQRMENKYYVEDIDKIYFSDSNHRMFIEDVISLIEYTFNTKVSSMEKRFLEINLASKILSEGYNIFINSDLNYLSDEMIKIVEKEFSLGIRKNFDLYLRLKQHLLSLDIRIKYNMNLTNPLLQEIKTNYSFAYMVAQISSTVLRSYYNKNITDDEIGYIALIFQLAIENVNIFDKKNILIVCSTGKGSANLLKHKYLKEFGEYINILKICDICELKDQELKDIDCIFTTVPLYIKAGIPIYQIGNIFKEKDKDNFYKILNTSSKKLFKKYFIREIVYISKNLTSKEEIIKYVCHKLKYSIDVKDEIYKKILAREALGSTDYGNFVAIPHSYIDQLENTKVYTIVLKKPIFWDKNYVQVVFLFLLGSKKDVELNVFFSEVTKVILEEKIVNEIIKTKKIDILFE